MEKLYRRYPDDHEAAAFMRWRWKNPITTMIPHMPNESRPEEAVSA
jgi:hypothetical protein